MNTQDTPSSATSASGASASPILAHQPSAQGATEGHAQNLGVAWHYGAPLKEQSQLSSPNNSPLPGPTAWGVVDRWDRGNILLTGSEVKEWLNNLISQKVDHLEDTQATSALILDAQGRVEFRFGITPCEQGILLDLPKVQLADCAEYLTKMIFWAQVELTMPDWHQFTLVTDSPASQVVPEVGGESRFATLGRAGIPDWMADIPGIQASRITPTGNATTVDVWVSADNAVAAWDTLTQHANPTGLMAWEALRTRARMPEVGVDLDEKTIPHEVPLFMGTPQDGGTQLASDDEGPSDGAVHLNKGCYRGQETISRVQNLGKSPRVLVLLQLDGSGQTLPEMGDDIMAGNRAVGRIGTVVQDSDFGPIALALVKRTVVEGIVTGKDVPPLTVRDVDVQIDPDDLVADTAERAGRAAVSRLRGK